MQRGRHQATNESKFIILNLAGINRLRLKLHYFSTQVYFVTTTLEQKLRPLQDS